MKERFYEFDLTRFLSMLGLPFFHILYISLMFNVCGADEGSVVTTLGFLRIFGPAIFMIALGANMVFSSHVSFRNLLLRALVIFIAANVLNVIRFIIPGVVGQAITGDASLMDAALLGMVTSDILFFAALVFLVFAFLVKFRVKSFYILVAAIVLVIISDLTTFESTGNPFIDDILANFVFIKGATNSFNFLVWFIYPVIGYVLGITVKNQSRKERSVFYKKMLIFSATFFVALSVGLIAIGADYIKIINVELNGCYCSFLTVLLNVSIVLAVLSVLYFVIYSIRSEKVIKAIVSCSERLFSFYILQWVFVMVAALACVAVIGFSPIPLWILLSCAVGVLIVSLIISKPLHRSYLKLMDRLRSTSHSDFS